MSVSKNVCNQLAKEKSPYLLQHKDNPVCWYAWGEDAFEAARQQNKAIFLSIGYSTCYWCHVMEKDSFEIPEVASIMNQYFINIKVDREERPDVDALYMEAVTSLTGRGGWPMSVFLTPELEPFWGGTFFYQQHFIRILEGIHSAWNEDPEKIKISAREITDFLNREGHQAAEQSLTDDIFLRAVESFKGTFDNTHAGFGEAPKFPPSAQISLLLRMTKRSDNPEALKMAEETLEKMAHGGIYDHLGGGFHRYSVDAEWHIPHFEKMLYDNALLAVSYLEAYQLTRKEIFKYVARDTLDYVLREMTSREGGFYSAQDAGEVEKEGEYYSWTESEIDRLLSISEAEKLKESYGVTSSGNFEKGQNALHFELDLKWKDKYQTPLLEAHKKLLTERSLREAPHKDDKILTAWNGLMLSAMAKGYQILREDKYLKAAQNCASFINDNMYKDEKLLRRYRDKEARFDGMAEDYAYLIEGLINLYEADFNSKWLIWSLELQQTQDSLFWDNKAGGYYFSVAKDLIAQKKEFYDGALPATNAVSFLNLLKLFSFTADISYSNKAHKLYGLYTALLKKAPTVFSRALTAVDYLHDEAKEIAVLEGDNKKETDNFIRKLQSDFIPNKVIAKGVPDTENFKNDLILLRNRPLLNNKTTVYVCIDHNCKLPVDDLEQAGEIIRATFRK